MKSLPTFIFLAISCNAFAGQSNNETGLSIDERKRIARTLEDALRDGDITKLQYDQSAFWINQSPCNGVERKLGPDKKSNLNRQLRKKRNANR